MSESFGPTYGLIAGNGRFPFLVLDGARSRGVDLSVVAIKEETDPSIEQNARELTWVGVGQLGKMISFFKNRGVNGGPGQTRPDLFGSDARCADGENALASAASKY
jgi:hypothetical protein